MTVTPPAVQVYTLGQFRVLVGGLPVEEHMWRRRSARQLLKLLLSRSGRRATRDEIIDTFWPESDPDAASSNLRSTLYALRNALQPDPQARNINLLFADRASVWLPPDAIVWTDADAFEKAVAEAFRTSDPLPLLESASLLYAGEYLPDDREATWAAERRDILQRTWTELQFGLATANESRANVDAAVRPLERLLRADACDERAARALMTLLARHGRRSDALRVYEHLVDSLRAELDLDPSPESAELNQQITSAESTAEGSSIAAFRCSYPFPAPNQLIGRQPELERLRQVMHDGRMAGRVVLVSGEAGTGKSALVGQIVREAQNQGVLCLAGGCYAERGALPLGPFHDALADFLLAQPADRARAYLGSSADDLARVIPELRQHLQLGSPRATSPPDRTLGFGAIHACLRSLSEQSRVLLCLEDLHAADEATLQLLHYLARQTRRLSLVLIGTFRADDSTADQTLSKTVTAMTRERLAQRIVVDALDGPGTDQLASTLLEGPTSAEFGRSLFTTTAGNPLFVEQLLLALQETDGLQRRGGVWRGFREIQGTPMIVREVITQRLQRLDADCREVLAMASVLGQTFDHRVLVEIVQPMHELVLLEHVDRAITTRILRETAGGYSFSHALLRDTVYWNLSAPRRMLLHAHIGHLLEEFHGPGADDFAGELARHFALAGDGDAIQAKALSYSLTAGRRASLLSAYAEAAVHFSRACELIERRGTVVPAETQLDALEGRGRAERELADWPAAVDTFMQILHSSTDTVRRARVRSMLVSALLFDDPGRALREIEVGLAELANNDRLPADAALARIHLLCLQGLVWFLLGRYRAVRALGRQMLSEPDTPRLSLGPMYAHSVIAWAEEGQGHLEEGLVHYQAALQSAEAAQNKIQEA
ncbi:MAG: AAA family ATPase, partial [Chloroflexi bacterium]|nr:AAA family ATPase [Chloroflexota bacterium]